MNQTIILKRISSLISGTFGVLIDSNNIPFCVTLERPWLNNQKSLSCIPARTYVCELGTHPKHGVCYQVMKVPDRDEILFHVGNTIEDTEGCILVGSIFDPDHPGILSSRVGYNDFMRKLSGATAFDLKIQEAF